MGVFAGESEALVAVGTCQAFGEDYPATGRVLLFQITRKPGSGAEDEEEWDSKMIYARLSGHRFGSCVLCLLTSCQTCVSHTARLCVACVLLAQYAVHSMRTWKQEAWGSCFMFPESHLAACAVIFTQPQCGQSS